ncbi:MAG: penicillin acylase family protein [Gammaproteobacteria bacterium]|nr:penicillin acylase family protein [Gammaproteobacteria bacterium]
MSPLPPDTSLQQRLAMFPRKSLDIKGRVVIHWDEHQIPFIEAEHDNDAAYALGLVHAHLRLGQMEMFRRIAQGRVAEMAGPAAADIDEVLRILDFKGTAAHIETTLPPDTLSWLQRYVDGVNDYERTTAQLPLEFQVLAMQREPWTVVDVLSCLRLGGIDFNWLVWLNLLELRQSKEWPQIWQRLSAQTSASKAIPTTIDPAMVHSALADIHGNTKFNQLGMLLASVGKLGSNSLSISSQRSATGSALSASDPHLGIMSPNPWVLAGIKSPSYHVVGMMVPGVPVFAIGRNPWIAWGGTNLRAASSDLVDVSNLSPDDITQREETIRVRWWFDRHITIRQTPWGPIVSEAQLLKDLGLPATALKWVGHQSSDEITAMLQVSRARDFGEFRAAFADFAVPAQTMVYADIDGRIGKVMAGRLPVRALPRRDLILSPQEAASTWSTMLGSDTLPATMDPPRGFIASGNDRPDNPPIPVGYFFSPDDRVKRMAQLLDDWNKVGVTELMALQQDVYMASSVALRDLLLIKLTELNIEGNDENQRQVIELLRQWDGYYRPDSRAALAYELVRQVVSAEFFETRFNGQDWAAFANVDRIKTMLLEDIQRAEPAMLRPVLLKALHKAAQTIADNDNKNNSNNTKNNWGEVHRLQLAHPLANMPLIGKRYVFSNLPVGGSNDTLMKTAHGAVNKRHTARYGSTARHVSDLSDLDHNYFVLLGGQDGWINSSTYLDQLPLWRAGEYIQLPLRQATLRERFAYHMELSP